MEDLGEVFDKFLLCAGAMPILSLEERQHATGPAQWFNMPQGAIAQATEVHCLVVCSLSHLHTKLMLKAIWVSTMNAQCPLSSHRQGGFATFCNHCLILAYLHLHPGAWT